MKGRGPLLILSLAALVVVLTGAGVLAWAMTHPSKATGTNATTAVASSHVRLRAMDLMTKAGCTDASVGITQTYSYETGRCQLHGVPVLIAMFDSTQLRDQWLQAARQVGGTFVEAESWAAKADTPEAAAALAKALGATVV